MRPASFLAVFLILFFFSCTKKDGVGTQPNMAAERITVKGHATHKYRKTPVAGMRLNIVAIVPDDLFSGHEEPVGSCVTDENGDYSFSFDNSSKYTYTEIRIADKKFIAYTARLSEVSIQVVNFEVNTTVVVKTEVVYSNNYYPTVRVVVGSNSPDYFLPYICTDKNGIVTGYYLDGNVDLPFVVAYQDWNPKYNRYSYDHRHVYTLPGFADTLIVHDTIDLAQ